MGLVKTSSEKVVLITGASSGIGEAIARDFAHRGGFHLVLCARRLERLRALTEEFSKRSIEAVAVQCDVTDRRSVDLAVQEALKRFGRIDIVVANAGFGVVGRFEKLSFEDYERQFQTNIYGVIHTAQATVDSLKKTRGRLAMIGSVTSYVSLPRSSAYSMSKYAVRAFAEALYHELKSDGVSVTLICPGFVESEIRQVGNDGVRRVEKEDPVPKLFLMPREKAAGQINSAILKRRREKIITWHGFGAVMMKRYFPSLFHFIASRLPSRGKSREIAMDRGKDQRSLEG